LSLSVSVLLQRDGFATPDLRGAIALVAIASIVLAACGGNKPAAHVASHRSATKSTVHSSSHPMIPATSATSTSSTTTTAVHGPTTTSVAPTTTTVASSGPSTDQMQIAQGGCMSLGDLSDAIGEAEDAGNTQPLQSFEGQSDYTLIGNLTLLNSVAEYQKLASDAGPFDTDMTAAVQSNDLSSIMALQTTMASDCQTLGLAIGTGN